MVTLMQQKIKDYQKRTCICVKAKGKISKCGDPEYDRFRSDHGERSKISTLEN